MNIKGNKMSKFEEYLKQNSGIIFNESPSLGDYEFGNLSITEKQITEQDSQDPDGEGNDVGDTEITINLNGKISKVFQISENGPIWYQNRLTNLLIEKDGISKDELLGIIIELYREGKI
jgi:hypothetical protein